MKSLRGRWLEFKDRYTTLTNVESIVPVVFAMIHVVLLVGHTARSCCLIEQSRCQLHHPDRGAYFVLRSIPSKAAELPEDGLDQLFSSYALLALSKGVRVSNEDVHDAWSV